MLASSGSSSALPKARELCRDSKMVMAKPTQIAETKKNTGSRGVYHSG